MIVGTFVIKALVAIIVVVVALIVVTPLVTSIANSKEILLFIPPMLMVNFHWAILDIVYGALQSEKHWKGMMDHEWSLHR